MFEPKFAGREPSPGALYLTGATVFVDDNDFAGVRLAAANLSKDLEAVTGHASEMSSRAPPRQRTCIVIGSIEKSPTVQRLAQDGQLDVSGIQGRWECYVTSLVRGEHGAKHLVIAGSDKRGAIFGTYSLSEQIGVSPWYWWADVPICSSGRVYAQDVVTSDGPPSVKYRGIFLNDEAPALSGWVHEKFGPVYNAQFYSKVFELLLRLKANFLWPAMWFGFPHPGNSFFMDDVENQALADRYGLVVGTSHHEPMQRAMNEWFSTPYNKPEGSWSWLDNKQDIAKYFREGAERAKGFESFITTGMRGDGDRGMVAEDPPKVLREVLATQRSIIQETYGREGGVPQLIALYKEVQEFYEQGFEVPDDITLLFTDDNFGSIRRLPYGAEKERKGRAGVYYHLEYVGEPRSYKWLHSSPLMKVWHQLDQAYRHAADQIWIFNVGDLKPLEMPMSFALGLGWKFRPVKDHNSADLGDFLLTFSEQTFGDDYAEEVRDLFLEYERFVVLRRHEHIEADTFSLLNNAEADGIQKQLRDLLTRAENVSSRLGVEHQASFFQLLLFPVKATYIFVALRVAQARNQLWALQRRNTANKTAFEVLRLFDEDALLTSEYHAMLDGKWNHIMRQPHYGFRETWHAPSRDMITGLSFVQTRADSNPIVGHLGIAVEGHAGVRPGLCNEESDRTHPTRRDRVPGVTLPPLEMFGARHRWFEVFSIATQAFDWSVEAPYDWVQASPPFGRCEPQGDDTRITLTIDWNSVPERFDNEVLLDVRTTLGGFEQIHLPVMNRAPPPPNFTGFVESDRTVSMHSTSIAVPTPYFLCPLLGRTGAGTVLGPADDALSGNSPTLEYPFYTFTACAKATLTLQFTFALDIDPTSPMQYQFALDCHSPSTYRLAPPPAKLGELPPGWVEEVMNNVWTRRHDIDLGEPGEHVMRVKLGNQTSRDRSNVGLEKIVMDLGGVRESYLGPTESQRVGSLQ